MKRYIILRTPKSPKGDLKSVDNVLFITSEFIPPLGGRGSKSVIITFFPFNTNFLL